MNMLARTRSTSEGRNRVTRGSRRVSAREETPSTDAATVIERRQMG